MTKTSTSKWNEPSHDLKQQLITAVTNALDFEERYREATFQALISSYSMAVKTVEMLQPRGPQQYAYWMGVASGYEDTLEILTRYHRIPEAFTEEANRSKAAMEQLRKLTRHERLQAREKQVEDKTGQKSEADT